MMVCREKGTDDELIEKMARAAGDTNAYRLTMRMVLDVARPEIERKVYERLLGLSKNCGMTHSDIRDDAYDCGYDLRTDWEKGDKRDVDNCPPIPDDDYRMKDNS